MIDFEDDSDVAVLPSADKLKNISQLAQKQRTIEKLIATAEATLVHLKDDHRRVSEVDLPEAMREVGMKEFRLDDGSKITIKKELYTSISEANKAEAFKWLEENDLGGVIKNDFTISFGRGDKDDAEEFMSAMNEQGFVYKRKESVHPQTLKALIKEQIEAGVEVPMDVFSVHEVNKSKVEV